MDQKSNEQSVPIDQGVNFMDILLVVAQNKRTVFGFPIGAAVIAAVISFVMSPVYNASVVLMPPQQSQSGSAALLAQLGGTAGMFANAAGIKNPGDIYIGMLKSRTLADAMIKRFDLFKVYELDSAERTRHQLEKNTSISAAKNGMITIQVEDGDKKRVAQMANAYVDELINITKVLAVTEAGQRRIFYEHQLKAAKDNLAAAELELKKGLDTRGVISVAGESQAIVMTVASLRAQISAKEIQLNSMRAFMTEANPDFRRVEEELVSLRAELARLENGRPDGVSGGAGPKGLENIRILRDVKYYQMLYELLAKQYELARLDEARDVSMIQVLDPAVEPEKRTRPKRVLLVLITFAISMVLGLVCVLLRDAMSKAGKHSGVGQKMAELRALFFQWK